MFDVLNEMSDDFDSTWDLSQEERRREERSRLTIDIYFDGTDANGIASTRDIGPSGLYLNTKAVLPEGARLALRIPFGNRQFLVDATVVYPLTKNGPTETLVRSLKRRTGPRIFRCCEMS